MTREAIADELRRQGALIQRSVTMDTDLVIALNKPSLNKLAKAKELGIRIITIEEVSRVASSVANADN